MRILKRLAFLFFLPLIFVKADSGHDWGDDFAQYLIQAKNIIENRPQTENGLVFDEKTVPYAVKAYPVGLPLLISPVYAVFGLKISAYTILISLLLALTGFMVFRYSGNHLTMLAYGCLLVYHPFSLDLKEQILTEIPFAFLLMCLLFFLRKDSGKALIGTAVLAGCIMSVRIAGIIVFPALLIYLIRKEQIKGLKNGLIVTGLAMAFFYLLNEVIFKVGLNDFLGFYKSQISQAKSVLAGNVKLYSDILSAFFYLPLPFILQKGIVLAVVVAAILRGLKKNTFTSIFSLLYLLLILFYPYSGGGYRLLFPMMPFLLIDIADLIQALSIRTKVHKLAPAFVPVLLLCTSLMFLSFNNHHDSPFDEASIEVFERLKDIKEKDVIVISSKPRLVHLMTGLRTTYFPQGENPVYALKFFRKMNVNYLLEAKEQVSAYDPKITDFASHFSQQKIWENDYFNLYNIKR